MAPCRDIWHKYFEERGVQHYFFSAKEQQLILDDEAKRARAARELGEDEEDEGEEEEDKEAEEDSDSEPAIAWDASKKSQTTGGGSDITTEAKSDSEVGLLSLELS